MAEQNIYIVKAGDTLSEIAQKFGIGSKDGPGGNDWMAGANYLGTKNNIEDIDYIVVGQRIKLFGIDEKVKEKPLYATIKAFGLQSRSQRGMYVSWHWGKKSETNNFEVTWQYRADGMWCNGTNTTVTAGDNYRMQSIYTAPDNATQVRVGVLPVSKTKSSNGKEVYWTAKTAWSDIYSFSDNPPEAPPTPSLDDSELKKLKLTASLSNLDAEWEKQKVKIEFQLVRNNSTVVKTVTSSIKTSFASASWQSPNITAGNEYKVRCRAVKEVDEDTLYSPWSAYSNSVSTKPGGVPKITKCQASKASDGNSDICVYLEWSAVNTADTYTVQYSTNESDFEYNAAQEQSGIESTKYKTTALTKGYTYYFRVRGENSNGETAWSEKVGVVVGEVPSAPTTWSSTTSVVAGNPVTLYWIHNTRDNSDETYANLEVYINDVKQQIGIIGNADKGTEEDGISAYVINTDGDADGSIIRWRVQTAGIANLGFGDWSEEREINIYANPTLDVTLLNGSGTPIDHDDPITSFPFYVKGLAGPASQVPIGYHISIVSNETYETLDYNGTIKMVSAGEEIYSKFFDISDPLLAELSAKDIDLEDKVQYTLTVTVTMDSGLDAEVVRDFKVSWTDEERWPGAEVGIDHDALVAYIRPYCEARKTRYLMAIRQFDNYGNISYTLSGIDVVPPEDESLITHTAYKADSGDQVYSFIQDASGSEVTFCVVSEVKESTDVLLSVYRREFDGTYTELATGIDPAMNTHVTDPHPALDYARYRVVATQKGTGAITYLDIPMHEVGEKAIVIQWDEEWTSFDTSDEVELAESPWHGSMLRLKYNIDVSDSYGSDNSLVKYIGRKYPVSYYGTQLESSSTWNVEIPKTDKETLYAIRRLAVWTGDVYVREPSGSGYWANISVSFSQKHRELTIPVTFNIKRVEGGV